MRWLFRPFSIFLPLFFLMVLAADAAQTSSCVTCHTNASIMKAMVKPPQWKPQGRGERERLRRSRRKNITKDMWWTKTSSGKMST